MDLPQVLLTILTYDASDWGSQIRQNLQRTITVLRQTSRRDPCQ
ncbi:MAG: hypothetical protein NW237_09595 [Cyanobacteriota bacterium]|nr:hypothetical protein [Cyanobacteriota bacterium]